LGDASKIQVQEMKMNFLKAIALAVLSASMLAACGGSSDDGAGSLTPLIASPNTKTVSGGADSCFVGYVGRFYITGGTPPYRLGLSDGDAFSFSNADPATPTTWANTAVIVSRVNNREEYFDLWASGVCVSPSGVTIFDAMGRLITVSLTNRSGA
jgi:hypothetical protein